MSKAEIHKMLFAYRSQYVMVDGTIVRVHRHG